jgi:hypothetical protein
MFVFIKTVTLQSGDFLLLCNDEYQIFQAVRMFRTEVSSNFIFDTFEIF